MTKVIEVLN